jgi:hypothetical protein
MIEITEWKGGSFIAETKSGKERGGKIQQNAEGKCAGNGIFR